MVMVLELAEWQSRLADHFTRLRATRGEKPLFALEHGLTAADREALSASIKATVSSKAVVSEYQLPWVVYATELGYGYSGDEYWQTFEQETPGWAVLGDRYWLRRCFRSFRKDFGGAEPGGPWAAHFSIICWPITHAILPKDLQRQLARILYEIRHSYSAELFESPARLGARIAARSWDAPSRFQNLAEEPALLGQIAAALLLEGEFGTGSLLHPPTLERISEDVDRERRGREWLRGARQSARDRAHIRGTTRGTKPSPTFPVRPEEARAEVEALGIEPQLVLRPITATDASWAVSLEIPDLSHILLRFPAAREVLTGSRCVVAGAAGRPLARGRVLHGAQRVTLERWPKPDEVLLKFEQTNPQLEYLLRTDCLLRPGSLWLFRIATDRLAYSCNSLRVRPGNRYIVVNTSGRLASTEYAVSISLQCAGADAAILSVPSALTSDWEECLRRLGLGQAKGIEVWPAGLSAVAWDGEGQGEWLVSQQPCLAIRADYSIESLRISLGERSESNLDLRFIMPGEPVFFELPRLGVGRHTVRIREQTSAGRKESFNDLRLIVRVRELRAWSPGPNLQGVLNVVIDPVNPTLEQLWSGHVDIGIDGPPDRSVKTTVSLFDKPDEGATIVSKLPPLPLPISSKGWKSHFEKRFRSTKGAQENYDSARICQLDFAAEELGGFVVQCERAFTPVRWAVRARRESTIVRLIDDSGESEHPMVAHFSFDKPLERHDLVAAIEYDASSDGGLYIATRGDLTAGVVVMHQIRELPDMARSVHIDTGDRSIYALKSALDVTALWRSGRPSGNFLSATNQQRVLCEITRHIMLLICGDRWATAERDFTEGRDSDLQKLKRAVSHRREELGVAAALALDLAALSTAPLDTRVRRLGDIAESFRITLSDAPSGTVTGDPIWLAELALRLASDPATVSQWAGKYKTLGLTRLIEGPTIVRAARFLVLASERYAQADITPDAVYVGWAWP